MQKIEAFLRPGALEQVQEALSEIGIVGMSVGEVRGFGRSGVTGKYIGGPSIRSILCPR